MILTFIIIHGWIWIGIRILLENCTKVLLILVIRSQLHQGLVLCESKILQMIWIAHILSLDFQVRSCPLAVLLWLDWVLYKLLELLRWSSFNAFHEGNAALPIMWGASESYRALRVVLEHEGRADVTFRSLMIHHTLLLADFGLIASFHWRRNIFYYLIFAFL